MAERVEGLSQLEGDSTHSRPGQRKRHETPPNLALIAALIIAAIMTLLGLVGLEQYRGAREQAAAVSQAFGQANARALTAQVWVTHVEDLLDLAESLIQREPPILTPAERARFLGE
jgi:hypothetical protein